MDKMMAGGLGEPHPSWQVFQAVVPLEREWLWPPAPPSPSFVAFFMPQFTFLIHQVGKMIVQTREGCCLDEVRNPREALSTVLNTGHMFDAC